MNSVCGMARLGVERFHCPGYTVLWADDVSLASPRLVGRPSCS
jgi:hypothetical protein